MSEAGRHADLQTSPLKALLLQKAAASARAASESNEKTGPDRDGPDITADSQAGPAEIVPFTSGERTDYVPTYDDRRSSGLAQLPQASRTSANPTSDLRAPSYAVPDATFTFPAQRVPRRRRRWGVILSFLAMVALPTAVAGFYYFFIAADQYVSEVRFALRSADRGKGSDGMGTGAPMAAAMTGIADSFIVADYITTRQFVDEIEPRVGLRHILSSPKADSYARFDPALPVEDLVEHWRSIVVSRYDLSTGILSVRVRAFTPEDSLLLAQAVLDASERLANELTERARHDSVRFAEDDVKQAETRLAQARDALREFRQRQGVVDPTRAANDQSDLLGRLKADLSRMRAELASLAPTMLPTAPPVQALNGRIAATEQQIQAIETESLRASHGPEMDMGAMISEFESLDLQRRFAEKSYTDALENLQRARVAGDRQQIYLATFARPALAEASRYPNRPALVALVFGLCLIAWTIALLVVLGVRDHLR